VRALAVTGSSRIPSLLDVPTFEELGVKGLDDGGWFAVLAPAKTPPAVIKKLSDAMMKTMSDPTMQKRLLELGLVATVITPEQSQITWTRTVKTVENVLKTTKIQME
jgi:tripartite-type tricarboxylate transporter receptor subunit TctC